MSMCILIVYIEDQICCLVYPLRGLEYLLTQLATNSCLVIMATKVLLKPLGTH